MQPQLLCTQKVCDYCGAVLEVTAADMGGEPRPRPYVCPQCSKSHAITSTGHPHVRVLKPRTDGKRGGYQETVF